MRKDLNAVSSEYCPNAATEIENNLILNWYPQRIITRFKSAPALLELGLGHGYTAKIFARASERYVAVDGSSVVIERFQANTPDFQGEIVESYFEDYTPAEPFDIIVMGFILEHVDDPDLILKRYRAFLKPGGKLYVAVPNAKSMNRRLGLEMGMIDDIYSLNANDIALGHQRQYCRDTLKAAVERAGYPDCKCAPNTEGVAEGARAKHAAPGSNPTMKQPSERATDVARSLCRPFRPAMLF
jgi:SAM-dependent methyltransferase